MNQNVSEFRTEAVEQQMISEGGALPLHTGDVTMPANTKTLRRNDWKQKMENRKKDNKTSKRQKNKRRRAQREQNKKTILNVHGLFSTIGDACNQGKKVAGHVDTARKLSDAIDGVKAALRYSGSSEEDLVENFICRLEDITALTVSLMNTKNYAGFIAILHMYIRTHYTKSTSKVVIELVSNLFRPTQSSSQNLEKLHLHSDEQEISPEDTVENIRDYIKDWRNMRHGPLAKNICQLLNILTTFGWIDLEENPIKVNDLELFRARAWDVQKNAFDFVDLVIDTTMFFIERGYLAFVKGDFSLLFHSDADTAAFEQEYSLLISCDNLMETGRLEDLKTETIDGEADFEQRLDKLIAKCYAMLQSENNPHAKALLTNRLVVLKKLRSKLIMLQKQSPLRTKPYGVCIFGGSAVGKSMINSIVTKVLLQRNKFPSSKTHIVTLNDSDPYQSEFRTYHTAVTLDDFGNTCADKYDSSPTAKIIDFLNNVPKAALSPIAELKGNVMIRPKVVSVTTNVKDLMAGTFSNEPASILRRFEVHMDVQLRPEWQDPETGGINVDMCSNSEIVPDAWIIQLQRIQINRGALVGGTKDGCSFSTILKDASLKECLDWMTTHSAKFFAQQEKFVADTEAFYEMDICEHYCNASTCKTCLALNNKLNDLSVHGAEFTLDEDNEGVDTIEDSVEWVPLQSTVENWYRQFNLDDNLRNVKHKCKTLKEAFELHKQECLGVLFGASATFALIYGALKLFKSSKHAVDALNDHGREDGVPIVLPEDHVSNWKKVEIAPIPVCHEGASRSREQTEGLIKRHLAICKLRNYETQRMRSCHIFPICGNTWLLPSHMFDKGTTVEIEVCQGPGDSINRKFQELIDDSKVERFCDDYMLVRLVKGGPVPNLLSLFLDEKYKFANEHVCLVRKSDEGFAESQIFRLKDSGVYTTEKGALNGLAYDLVKGVTEAGLCIAPIFTYRNPSVILGFHLAGRTGRTFGVAGTLLKPDIEAALGRLYAKNNLQCHSEGTMRVEKYGINFTPSKNIPEDHAVKRLEDDAEGQPPSALVYGSHTLGRSFFKSNVRTSIISKAVKKHLPIERLHGPPNRENIGQHWERDLNLMAHPKGNFQPKIWNKAREDFRHKVTTFLDTHPDIVAATYPLSHDHILAGADGIAAFSRVPLNTSMGWPINKAKKNFIGPVEKEVEGVSEPIDFNDPMFMEMIEEMEECMARGERVHTVFRGNLKDEPTKWTKNKIRVFAGCEMSFTYIVRKYCLPIVRLIQNNWKEFECAVGINAHGPQWEELYQQLTKFGRSRCNAGDFAHFDKSASPEPMLSGFDIFMLIAEYCGYSARALMIMRGIATEISYPIYELDGVLIQLFGSNPSGHPLTVIINNMMNSLYMRYAYYKLHENDENVPYFDQVIALICYGDDNASNISEEETKFNMVNVAPVLAEAGITYTKADKTEIKPGDEFQDIAEIDFLKRKFVWNEPFGAHTAALDISSIGKSLHNQMVSKTTPREVIAADAIHSANREFAFHGPEVFKEMRPGLEAVIEECDLRGLVGELPTLSELVDRYHGSKMPRAMMDEPPLTTQCSDVPMNAAEDRLQCVVERVIGLKPLMREVSLGNDTFGAPDLVFAVHINGLRYIVSVETKSVSTGDRHRKLKIARSQARKYGSALAILTPMPTVALIYSELGFELVLVERKNRDCEPLRQMLLERIDIDIGVD